MKVKIFGELTLSKLEETMNEFIKDKRVLDVKYQIQVVGTFTLHFAMVMYEDYVYKRGDVK
jgi:hypothetical protein